MVLKIVVLLFFEGVEVGWIMCSFYILHVVVVCVWGEGEGEQLSISIRLGKRDNLDVVLFW